MRSPKVEGASEEHEPTPILRALRFVAKKSTGEVRVHVSRDRFEKDPMGTALRLFEEFGMTRTTDRNAVLVYLNRATRRFAVIADEGVHRAVGQKYWDGLAANFSEDLRGTHFENAIALLVFSVGTTLAKKFPRD
ncbi:MAG: TPM domain-containing protein [Bdellovibrionales bacterium]|nr:TPM domain-containing protein [Bdellovibrionales bacterium]